MSGEVKWLLWTIGWSIAVALTGLPLAVNIVTGAVIGFTGARLFLH